MEFGPSMSYQVRVTKRKFKKGRFFTILILFIILVAAIVFLFKGGIVKKINSVFSSSTTQQNVGTTTNSSTVAGTTQKESTVKSAATSTESSLSNSAETTKVNVVKDYKKLKSELENYIKGFQGQYGVCFIDLDNGSEFGINASDAYIAASTVKVPINLYLFKKIEDGSINPTDTMVYQAKDKEGGTGYIQTKKLGSKYTIRELSKLSIQVSDNVAVNMLIRLIGKQNYKDFMKQMGGQVVTDKNISCPKDMAVYLKNVYAFNKSNPTLGGELIGYLENTVFNDRIPKLLPKDIKVAHKIGNQVAAIHDVGIVYAEKPYIIAVMSKNASEAEGYNVIANISKKVYDFMTNSK